VWGNRAAAGRTVAGCHSAGADRCRVAAGHHGGSAAVACSANRPPPAERAQLSASANRRSIAADRHSIATAESAADRYSSAKSAAAVTNRAGCAGERELYSERHSIAGAANRPGYRAQR